MSSYDERFQSTSKFGESPFPSNAHITNRIVYVEKQPGGGVVMRGNLLTQSQSSVNSLQKKSMADNQFSPLL